MIAMRNNVSYSKDYQVYPGEYIPLPEVEALLHPLKTPGEDSAAKPLVNMDEFKDYYKVAVMVPGVKREDICIHVHDNILSIHALFKDMEGKTKEKFQLHEFDTECLERHMLLPDNADIEFISAEYKQGILHIHIPKAHTSSPAKAKQIVVY